MRSPSIIHFVIVVVSNTCGDNNEEVFREAIVHLWSLIMHFVVEILISLINKCYSRFYSNDWKIISISLQVHSTFLHPPVCLRVQLSITYVCNSLQYVFLLVLSEQVTGKKNWSQQQNEVLISFMKWNPMSLWTEGFNIWSQFHKHLSADFNNNSLTHGSSHHNSNLRLLRCPLCFLWHVWINPTFINMPSSSLGGTCPLVLSRTLKDTESYLKNEISTEPLSK